MNVGTAHDLLKIGRLGFRVGGKSAGISGIKARWEGLYLSSPIHKKMFWVQEIVEEGPWVFSTKLS